MDRLRALEIFKAVADHGSFVKAADALDLSCAAVTRGVQDLEGLLGLRLLHRTTRHVSITPDGTDVLRRAESLLDSFADLASLGRARDQHVAGKLQLLAPATLGARSLCPVLASFVARHPNVLPHLQLSDDLSHGGASGVDLILYLSATLPESFVVRRLGHLPMVLAGAQSYLRRRGEPLHPRELASHECLSYTGTGFGEAWSLSNRLSGESLRHHPAGAFGSNNAEALLAAATQGMGLVLLPEFLAAEAIATGSLQPVLTDWLAEAPALHVAYGSRSHQPARVRAFIDHLSEHLCAAPSPGRLIAGRRAVQVSCRPGVEAPRP